MDYMEINVTLDGNFESCPDISWFQEITKRTLAAEGVGSNAEMGLLITGQRRMQQLNKAYRSKDKPTDVLSFAFLADSSNGKDPSFSTPPDSLKHLGEVIISYPQAVIQAQEEDHSIKRELALLVVHGVLHLLGYDHVEDKEADIMEARQDEILNCLKEALD